MTDGRQTDVSESDFFVCFWLMNFIALIQLLILLNPNFN